MKFAHKTFIQDERYYPKLDRPSLLDGDTMFYFCSSHYSGYKKNKTRRICTCELANMKWINIVSGNVRRGMIPSSQSILFYDSSFIADYILPLYKKEEDRRIIEYTLSNANDDTFKNIIDFERKIIINENAYFYPINSQRILSIFINNFEWFKSVVPQEKWIYNHGCYNEDIAIYLHIPLLDEIPSEEKGSQ
jgi:hypothetical protein